MSFQTCRAQWNEIACLLSTNKRGLSAVCCFWNCSQLAKTRSHSVSPKPLGENDSGWNSLHVNRNRKTIPKPIKVSKSAVPLAVLSSIVLTLELLHNVASHPRHLLGWKILIEHMALGRITCALFNSGGSASALASQEIPVLLHSQCSQRPIDNEQCTWRRMFASSQTALLTGHGC